MNRVLLLVAAFGSLGCGRALTDGTVTPGRRAAIAHALTSQPMRSVIHGSTMSVHSVTRYGTNGQVKVFTATQSHGDRQPVDLTRVAPRTGTFALRPNGALEERWGQWTTRQTGHVADGLLGAPGFVWGAFYEVATREGTYQNEEMARHDTKDGFHVIVELSFTDRLSAPKPFETISCEVLVHLRVRLLEGHESREAEAVDVYLPCRVKLNEHGPRISFDDKTSLGDALDPWLRPRASAKLRHLAHEKTPRALTFDPSDPSVLWRAP